MIQSCNATKVYLDRSNKNLNIYLSDIRSFVQLGEEELRSLFQKMRAATSANERKRLKDRIFNGTARIVLSCVTDFFYHQGFQQEDLIDEGNMGLLEAIDRFNPELTAASTEAGTESHVKFITYAVWYVKKYIHEYRARYDSTVKIPKTLKESFRKLKKAEERFMRKFGYEPSDEELMDYAGVKEDDVQFYRMGGEPMRDSEVYGSDDSEPTDLIDNLADPESHLRIGNYTGSLIKKAVGKEIDQLLNEKQGEVLRLAYGLNKGHICESFENIGREKGVSGAAVGKMHERALKELSKSTELSQLYSDLMDEDGCFTNAS